MTQSTVETGTYVLGVYRSELAWRLVTGTTPTSTANTTQMLFPVPFNQTTTTPTQAKYVMHIPSSTVGDVGINISQSSYSDIVTKVQNPFIRAGVYDSVTDLRAALIAEVFSGNGLPATSVNSITTGVSNPLPSTNTSVNLARVDRLTIQMSNYAGSTVDTVQPYMFIPTTANGKLAIITAGHGAGSTYYAIGGGRDEIFRRLTDEGYTVVGNFMPFVTTAPNETHATTENVVDRTSTLNYLKFFVEPAVRIVNQFSTFSKYFIGGVSGGGWTADLVMAIDDRFAGGANACGSMPLFYSDTGWNGFRDWEQLLPLTTASAVDYQDLYVMNATGTRRYLQANNTSDNCCFFDDQRVAGPSYTTQVIAATSGNYTYNVQTSNTHQLDKDTIANVINLWNIL
jgi:hypothetical protein